MLGYVLAVWAVAIIGGILPYGVGTLGEEKGASGNSWLSVLNVMSGGVFVAAGFMHLLPEAQESLEQLSERFHFEFALFFASLGFIAVFLLEEAVEQVSASLNPYKRYSFSATTDGLRDKDSPATAQVPSPLHPPRCDYDRLKLRPATEGVGSCYCGLANSDIGGGIGGSGVGSSSSLGSSFPGAGGGASARHASVGIGIGYGINNIEGAGRPVDENYHMYPSSVESGLASPAFIFDQKHLQLTGGGGGGIGDETLQLKGPEAEARAAAATVGIGVGGKAFPGGVRLGNFEDSWGSLASSRGHVTSLRGAGPAKAGIKRLGSKKGSYGAIAQPPARACGSGYLSGSGGVVSRGGGATAAGGGSQNPKCDLANYGIASSSHEIPLSPARDGHGPWIGRKFVGPDPALSFDLGWSSHSLLAEEARIASGKNDDAAHRGGVTRPGKHPHPHDHGVYSANVGLILGAALSFHAIVEGLGLGASSDSSAPGIFAAIVVHKGLVAFSLGCIFFSSAASRLQYFLFMTIFSLLTPLGAFVGIIVRANTEGSAGAGICTALGAGTFLHVAAMEILPRDLLHDQRRKKTKMVALVLGYLVFAWLSLYV